MAVNRFEKKDIKKLIFTATVVIGTSTLLSMGILQAATATELKKTNMIPTNYVNQVVESPQTAQDKILKNYKKSNYKVVDNDLEYYRNQTPTIKDISKEDAAEIGVQALWEVFGVNLEGQVIEMGYQSAMDGLPRSTWEADVMVNGELSYSFSVDSVTGELFNIVRSGRTLEGNNSVALDANIDKNLQEFVVLAKELAEKHNVVHGTVKTVEYNGQGYTNNDPTISLDIIGENGEIALMTLSRYDKELLGISYSASYKPLLEETEKLLKETHEKAKELEK